MPGTDAPSLARAFWVQVLPPRAFALLALWRLGAAPPLPLAQLGVLLACDLLLFAWQIRRFQASADSHIRHHGGLAPVWGGQLALLFAAFAAASLWWGAFLNASQPADRELFTDRMDRLHAASYRLDASPDGRVLRFEGLITFGLTGRMNGILAQNPEAELLILTSPGGHIYEARGAAYSILAQGLETRAAGDCSSACTLLFAAGTRRSMARGARLGFHGYGLESGGSLPHVDVAEEQEKDRRFLQSRGVPEAFLARLFDAPPDSMLFLSPAEAAEAGLLHP